MTPDELEELVLTSKDPWALQVAFSGLDEKQRGNLSAAAQKTHKQLNRGKAGEGASGRMKRHLGSHPKEAWRRWQQRENRNAKLALYALGPVSAVKKSDARVQLQDWPVLEKIVDDRRPDWLDEWIAHELDEQFTFLQFRTLRAWIKSGACRKPRTDGYYRLFAAHLMRTNSYDRKEEVPALSRQLLADPDLLEDIEGIFRVETIAFNTNSWLVKGASKDFETWPQALRRLSAEGRLDRERLLRLALDGLLLDIKQNQLAGYHRFYRDMEPTEDELRRHQRSYIDLLRHPVGHVSKFAVDMLAKVAKLGALDADALGRLQDVFAHASKGNALAALKLIERHFAGAKTTPDADVLTAVTEGLRHPNAEVQAEAIDILERHGASIEATAWVHLSELEGFVLPSNRAKFREFLAGSHGLSVANDADLDTRQIEPEEAVAYVPISRLGEAPILFDEDQLEPIGSLDELIDAVLHAVEIIDSPDDIERIIDGISRMADDRPADFDRRTAPLLRRLNTGAVGIGGLAAGRVGVGAAVLDLVQTWASGKLVRSAEQRFTAVEDGFVPMLTHATAVTRRVARRQAQPLLSAPTHKGGWIDPLAWVERLRRLQSVDGIAATMDLRLSLLRLAPDNRERALEQARDLAAPVRRIAMFALGGDERPVREDRANHPVWISAARCRAPFADWSEAFQPLRLNDPCPDSVRPAVWSWRSWHTAGQFEKMRWIHGHIDFEVGCGGAQERAESGFLSKLAKSLEGQMGPDWRELPSAAQCRLSTTRRFWSGDLTFNWMTQWLAYQWPQNPTGAQMRGAAKLVDRMDENSSNLAPGFGYLHSLFQRNRPWGEGAHLVLVLGLVGKDADAKALALDALIDGIEGRIFNPAIFAGVLRRLCAGEWVKLNRLGEGLLQAVRLTPLHAQVIGEALQTALPSIDLGQKKAFHLLEVLNEVQAITGQPLNEPVQAALTKVTGSGKAAVLAKRLLRNASSAEAATRLGA